MNLYEKTPKYNSRTGKLEGHHYVEIGIVCDCCGAKYLEEDEIEWPNETGLVTYTVNDNFDSEPMFYYEEIQSPDGKVDNYSVFARKHDKFVFCDMPGKNCEDSLPGGVHFWHRLYTARTAMLNRTLNDGTYTLEDFQLELD